MCWCSFRAKSFDVGIHGSLIFPLAFPKNVDKSFSGKFTARSKAFSVSGKQKTQALSALLCCSFFSIAAVYTRTQTHTASRWRSLTYLANGILGCHMWQHTESRTYYERSCDTNIFHKRRRNLIGWAGVSAACYLTCLVTNLSFTYALEISAPSLHARQCRLHCRHGHGPPIGGTDKTCFLSTHNGSSQYILKTPFEIIAKNLNVAVSRSHINENENQTSYNKPPPLEKAVHGLQIYFFSHLTLEKYYVCCLALPFIATVLSKASNNIANSNER